MSEYAHDNSHKNKKIKISHKNHSSKKIDFCSLEILSIVCLSNYDKSYCIVWTPLFIKEGWDFSKMAVMGGWEFFTRNGGEGGGGGDFKMWGWEIFEVSLHSW